LFVAALSPLHRQLGLQSASLDRALRRLSTGLRITSAADDAAGLAIASKLRSQVLGFNQASRNIQDAVSMLQTADGGLEGIQGMLQRIRELAVSAGNDTLTFEDRKQIQAEIDLLRRGVQQVAEGTSFNTHQVLRGEMTGLGPAHTNLDPFTRGVSRSQAVPTSVESQQQSKDFTIQSLTHANSQAYSTRDFNPGWSLDDSQIQVHSTRGGGAYVIPSTGGTATASPSETFTRDRTREIGGRTYQLSDYRTIAGGTRIYDGIYVVRDDGARVKLVDLVDSTGVQMAFSNDGSRVAYAGFTESDVVNTDVYVTGFNAAAMSRGGTYRLNQDHDMLDVPQAYTLAAPAEWYQRTDGERSLKIFVERNTPSGAHLEVPHDPGGAEGFTLSADRRTFTLHGSYQVDSNDVIRAYYQNDYRMATNDDGNISLVPTTVPAIYDLGTPASSVRIEVGGVAVAYDPTHANGYDYDPTTNRFTLYGDARPAGNQNVVLYFQGDRASSESYVDTLDQDHEVAFALSELPEIYNLTNSNPSKSIRVYVGGAEVPHDDGSGNGYAYDASTNRILLRGTARPAANQDVLIRYVTDDGNIVKNQNGTLQVVLSGPGTDTYYQSSAGPVRSLRVLVGGVEVPLDGTNGYSYNEPTRTVTFNGSALPDGGQRIEVRWTAQNDTDDLYTIPLAATPELYDPEDGSIVVTSSSTGTLTRVMQTDGSGDGYFVQGSTIRLVGSARPNASGASTTYTAYFVRPGDNTFALSPTAPPPAAIDPDWLPHYIPPSVTAAVLDEGSLVVRVNNSLVSQDDSDGWSLAKTPGPIIDGIQTYGRYDITLNGDSRLMGRPGNNAITVEYGFRYAARDPKEYSFMVGAGAAATMISEIPPVGIDELDLNAVFVLNAGLAKEAIRKADAALAKVSKIRSGIGATINGLGHQLRNVMQMGMLNEQSRSRIVGADVAREAMGMARSQILMQSATAMLQQGRVSAQRTQELILGGLPAYQAR
jgi:flagellin-like hook-associated protein FlgL